MKGFLLDTNVLSEARKGRSCEPKVAAWLTRKPLEKQFTSVICLMEIRLGIHLAARKNPEFALRLENWYGERVKAAFAARVLTVDILTAETCARLHAGRTRSFRDALIGATAATHGLVMVTRNTSDFADMNLTLLNPWEA